MVSFLLFRVNFLVSKLGVFDIEFNHMMDRGCDLIFFFYFFENIMIQEFPLWRSGLKT